MRCAKKITIKNPLLRRFRSNLRKIIMLSVDMEVERLCNISLSLLDTVVKNDPYLESSKNLIKSSSNLHASLLNASLNTICRCRFCGSTENDMEYVTHELGWICASCYSKFLESEKDRKKYKIKLEH